MVSLGVYALGMLEPAFWRLNKSSSKKGFSV